MESFERWDFVIWQGAWGDAVQAPLAVRDDAQSAKGQAHTIAWRTDTLVAQAPHLASLGRLFRTSVVKILARCTTS
jgi:hypothetical protein